MMRRSVMLLLAAVWLGSCQRFPQQNSLRLVDELATARKGNIVIGQGFAGRPAFRTYLGPALRFDLDGDWVHGADDQRGPAFGFYLYETLPLVVTVAARGTASEVEFFSGELSLGRFAFATPQEVSFEVPAEAVKPGWNWIDVQNAGQVSFAQFLVRPLGSAVSTINGRPFATTLSADGQSLLLPFGQSVDFALESSELSQLRLEMDSWVEAGADQPKPDDLTLHVRVQREGQPDWQQSVVGSGPATLDLPPGLGRFALQLRAELAGTQTPLPGQAGIKLTSLLLQRSQAPPSIEAPPKLSPSPPSPQAPVILVVIDTLRADRLSTYGYRFPTSPHLEAMAQDSVVFEDVTAQSPWTKPSVASILTGLEPNQHRALDFSDHLDGSLTTMAEFLKAAGYQTFAVVANPLLGQRFGFDQGFDRFRSLPVVNNAHRVTQDGLELLAARDKEKPFFLYLHPIDPHLPYSPPNPWRKEALEWHGVDGSAQPLLPSFDRQGFVRLTSYLFFRYLQRLPHDVPEPTANLVGALYDGEVKSADAALGQLLGWLKEQDLYEGSMIIVTSDHGEELLERGRLGHTHTLYQELLRVPMVIKFPKGQFAGRRDKGLWQQVDILPTVLAALGIPAGNALDGLGYPADLDRAGSRQALFEVSAGADAVEAGQAPASYLELGSGLRAGSLKLVHHDSSVSASRTVRALFDLASDPKENRDLLQEKTVEALFLEKELARRKARPARVVPKRASDQETREVLRSLDYLR
jgi:arylsulfatase A-like enzyme